MSPSSVIKHHNNTTARLLSEALPHIRRHDKAIIVIKLGGHAMSSKAAMLSFARDIVLLHQCNLYPVIVHGGAPMINAMLERLNIPSKFKNGKRISCKKVVEIAEMILCGSVNKQIVQAINQQDGRAVGLSGKDANLLICKKYAEEFGMVGEPCEVNVDIIHTLCQNHYIPVIAPLGCDYNGATFNVNGDTAAGNIAAALKASRLLLLTDVQGVKNDKGQVLSKLNPAEIKAMIKDGVISKGMIPKTQTALTAIQNGVEAVVIIDGRVNHACLLELFTDHGVGSMVCT